MSVFDELAQIKNMLGDCHTPADYGSDDRTPVFTGFSADPASPICRYILVGHMCTCFVQMPNTGTSGAATFYVTAPFTAATVTGMVWYGHIGTQQDNGAWMAPTGQVVIVSGGTYFRLSKTTTGNDGWTTSGNKVANFAITYETE